MNSLDSLKQDYVDLMAQGRIDAAHKALAERDRLLMADRYAMARDAAAAAGAPNPRACADRYLQGMAAGLAAAERAAAARGEATVRAHARQAKADWAAGYTGGHSPDVCRCGHLLDAHAYDGACPDYDPTEPEYMGSEGDGFMLSPLQAAALQRMAAGARVVQWGSVDIVRAGRGDDILAAVDGTLFTVTTDGQTEAAEC